MKKVVPKVKFEAMTIPESTKSIHGFLNPYKNEWDWSQMIYSEYPELKVAIKGIKKVGCRKEAELVFFENYINTHKIDLNNSVEKFQQNWDEIGDKILSRLSDIVETDWEGIPSEIVGRVSLNPINPRDVFKFNFDLFYKYSLDSAMNTIIHEIFHFIYFKKWREVFPGTKDRDLDAPRLVWQLSEMVPGIVLNDSRIQSVFKSRFHSYDDYEAAKIKGKPLLKFLQEFYDTRKDFTDFLIKSWDFVQKNQEFIKSL